jgi:hypothetical protein
MVSPLTNEFWFLRQSQKKVTLTIATSQAVQDCLRLSAYQNAGLRLHASEMQVSTITVQWLYLFIYYIYLSEILLQHGNIINRE